MFRCLLTPDKPADKEKPKPVKPQRASRDDILALRAEVRKSEERVTKINDMRDKLAKKLADPTSRTPMTTGREEEARNSTLMSSMSDRPPVKTAM